MITTCWLLAAAAPASFRFGQPWLLLLLALLPLLAWCRGKVGQRPAFLYSSVALARPLDRPVRSRVGAWLTALRWLTLALLVVALARPQLGESQSSITASGVDIVVALDLSGSMEALDFELKGERANRLDMAKEVLTQFIAKRPSDRIGVVAFAGRAYVACPLTLDHDFLRQNLDRLDLNTIREDGTAIGSALTAALNRLREVESKSKIVILMTDGQNNTGKIPPLTAAEAAQALKVKTYTVGIGRQGMSEVARRDSFGRMVYQPVKVDIDEETLKAIAQRTSGKYYRADDTRRFREIYIEIDRLEKTEVKVNKIERTHELAHWVILGGVFLLLLEQLLAQTIWRRLP